jgi:hypothetical protein
MDRNLTRSAPASSTTATKPGPSTTPSTPVLPAQPVKTAAEVKLDQDEQQLTLLQGQLPVKSPISLGAGRGGVGAGSRNARRTGQLKSQITALQKQIASDKNSLAQPTPVQQAQTVTTVEENKLGQDQQTLKTMQGQLQDINTSKPPIGLGAGRGAGAAAAQYAGHIAQLKSQIAATQDQLASDQKAVADGRSMLAAAQGAQATADNYKSSPPPITSNDPATKAVLPIVAAGTSQTSAAQGRVAAGTAALHQTGVQLDNLNTAMDGGVNRGMLKRLSFLQLLQQQQQAQLKADQHAVDAGKAQTAAGNSVAYSQQAVADQPDLIKSTRAAQQAGFKVDSKDGALTNADGSQVDLTKLDPAQRQAYSDYRTTLSRYSTDLNVAGQSHAQLQYYASHPELYGNIAQNAQDSVNKVTPLNMNLNVQGIAKKQAKDNLDQANQAATYSIASWNAKFTSRAYDSAVQNFADLKLPTNSELSKLTPQQKQVYDTMTAAKAQSDQAAGYFKMVTGQHDVNVAKQAVATAQQSYDNNKSPANHDALITARNALAYTRTQSDLAHAQFLAGSAEVYAVSQSSAANAAQRQVKQYEQQNSICLAPNAQVPVNQRLWQANANSAAADLVVNNLNAHANQLQWDSNAAQANDAVTQQQQTFDAAQAQYRQWQQDHPGAPSASNPFASTVSQARTSLSDTRQTLELFQQQQDQSQFQFQNTLFQMTLPADVRSDPNSDAYQKAFVDYFSQHAGIITDKTVADQFAALNGPGDTVQVGVGQAEVTQDIATEKNNAENRSWLEQHIGGWFGANGTQATDTLNQTNQALKDLAQRKAHMSAADYNAAYMRIMGNLSVQFGTLNQKELQTTQDWYGYQEAAIKTGSALAAIGVTALTGGLGAPAGLAFLGGSSAGLLLGQGLEAGQNASTLSQGGNLASNPEISAITVDTNNWGHGHVSGSEAHEAWLGYVMDAADSVTAAAGPGLASAVTTRAAARLLPSLMLKAGDGLDIAASDATASEVAATAQNNIANSGVINHVSSALGWSANGAVMGAGGPISTYIDVQDKLARGVISQSDASKEMQGALKGYFTSVALMGAAGGLLGNAPGSRIEGTLGRVMSPTAAKVITRGTADLGVNSVLTLGTDRITSSKMNWVQDLLSIGLNTAGGLAMQVGGEHQRNGSTGSRDTSADGKLTASITPPQDPAPNSADGINVADGGNQGGSGSGAGSVPSPDDSGTPRTLNARGRENLLANEQRIAFDLSGTPTAPVVQATIDGAPVADAQLRTIRFPFPETGTEPEQLRQSDWNRHNQKNQLKPDVLSVAHEAMRILQPGGTLHIDGPQGFFDGATTRAIQAMLEEAGFASPRLMAMQDQFTRVRIYYITATKLGAGPDALGQIPQVNRPPASPQPPQETQADAAQAAGLDQFRGPDGFPLAQNPDQRAALEHILIQNPSLTPKELAFHQDLAWLTEATQLRNPHDPAQGVQNTVPSYYERVTDLASDSRLAGLTQKDLEGPGNFYAGLFRDSRNGNYVVAFRGTQTRADAYSNVKQGIGLRDGQYTKAIELGRKLKDALSDDLVAYTGHSRGGGQAAAAAMARTQTVAVTFNAAGLRPITLRRAGVPGDARLITNYHVQDEFLSHYQDRSRLTRRLLPSAAGTQISLLPLAADGRFLDPTALSRSALHRSQTMRDSMLMSVPGEAQDQQARSSTPPADATQAAFDAAAAQQAITAQDQKQPTSVRQLQDTADAQLKAALTASDHAFQAQLHADELQRAAKEAQQEAADAAHRVTQAQRGGDALQYAADRARQQANLARAAGDRRRITDTENSANAAARAAARAQAEADALMQNADRLQQDANDAQQAADNVQQEANIAKLYALKNQADASKTQLPVKTKGEQQRANFYGSFVSKRVNSWLPSWIRRSANRATPVAVLHEVVGTPSHPDGTRFDPAKYQPTASDREIARGVTTFGTVLADIVTSARDSSRGYAAVRDRMMLALNINHMGPFDRGLLGVPGVSVRQASNALSLSASAATPAPRAFDKYVAESFAKIFRTDPDRAAVADMAISSVSLRDNNVAQNLRETILENPGVFKGVVLSLNSDHITRSLHKTDDAVTLANLAPQGGNAQFRRNFSDVLSLSNENGMVVSIRADVIEPGVDKHGYLTEAIATDAAQYGNFHNMIGMFAEHPNGNYVIRQMGLSKYVNADPELHFQQLQKALDTFNAARDAVGAKGSLRFDLSGDPISGGGSGNVTTARYVVRNDMREQLKLFMQNSPDAVLAATGAVGAETADQYDAATGLMSPVYADIANLPDFTASDGKQLSGTDLLWKVGRQNYLDMLGNVDGRLDPWTQDQLSAQATSAEQTIAAAANYDPQAALVYAKQGQDISTRAARAQDMRNTIKGIQAEANVRARELYDVMLKVAEQKQFHDPQTTGESLYVNPLGNGTSVNSFLLGKQKHTPPPPYGRPTGRQWRAVLTGFGSRGLYGALGAGIYHRFQSKYLSFGAGGVRGLIGIARPFYTEYVRQSNEALFEVNKVNGSAADATMDEFLAGKVEDTLLATTVIANRIVRVGNALHVPDESLRKAVELFAQFGSSYSYMVEAARANDWTKEQFSEAAMTTISALQNQLDHAFGFQATSLNALDPATRLSRILGLATTVTRGINLDANVTSAHTAINESKGGRDVNSAINAGVRDSGSMVGDAATTAGGGANVRLGAYRALSIARIVGTGTGFTQNLFKSYSDWLMLTSHPGYAASGMFLDALGLYANAGLTGVEVNSLSQRGVYHARIPAYLALLAGVAAVGNSILGIAEAANDIGPPTSPSASQSTTHHHQQSQPSQGPTSQGHGAPSPSPSAGQSSPTHIPSGRSNPPGTQPNQPSQAPTPQAVAHGDSLWTIAKQRVNERLKAANKAPRTGAALINATAHELQSIEKANPQLRNRHGSYNRIYPGDQIVLPMDS